MMNVIIYHDHCMDGFAAAYIAATHFKECDEPFELIPASYGDELPEIHPDSSVYVLDFSYPPEKMHELILACNDLTWLDHHKTAIEAWHKYWNSLYREDCIPGSCYEVLDKTRSGAGIAWDYFNPHSPRPNWVNWIEDRDLWKFQYEDSKPFHAGMSQVKRTIDLWRIALNNTSQVLQTGDIILSANAKLIQEIIDESANDIVILGQKGLAANCPPQFASDAGHELAVMSGTFGATWHQTKSGDVKFSLRSNGSFDVSEIARQFGGGGHKNAAGFVLKNPIGAEGKITLWARQEAALMSGVKHE